MSKKISSIVFYAIIVISLAVLYFFYMGGSEVDANGNDAPFYTEYLIFWMYGLMGTAIVVTLGASLVQFVGQLIHSPKQALQTLAGLILFAVVLGTTWSLGDGTPLHMVGYEGTDNVSFWLKLTDMFLLSTYALITIAIICIFLGSLKKAVGK